MNRILLLFCLMLALGACQEGQNSSTNSETAEATDTPAAPSANHQYTSVPLDTLTMLWENCDYIDYIFYNFNFSMSQNEKNSIRTTLRHIAEQVPPSINPACKPMGRIFYQVDGRNALEGEFYLGEGCLYYIFFKDGKPAYANLMTNTGVDFFRNILTQMMNSSQQGQ